MDVQNLPSPMQLGKRIVTGLSIFVASSLGFALASSKRLEEAWHFQSMRMPILLAFFALSAGALASEWRAESRLQRGIREEKWQEVELAPLWLWVNQPWATTIVSIVWIVGGLMYFSACLSSTGDHLPELFGVSFWCVGLPAMAFGRVKTMLTPRPAKHVFDWSGMKPIQSEHWGEHDGANE
jgi:hypothetical protein